MPAELHEFLTRDHERLDALLATCLRNIHTPIVRDAIARLVHHAEEGRRRDAHHR